MRASILFSVLLSLPIAGALAAEQNRVTYDGQCLTIDGRDTLIFSGAFHYFRCPKELWRDRFAKIKEAGCNAVETYVAWNWHEQQMPADVNDFSHVDLTDLKDWLRMAHEEFALYTIIRPGPYICAEWALGGYPAWLLNKRPAEASERVWLRSDETTYLAWSKHWFDAVCPVIAAEQVTRKPAGKPGVILFQIENEYDYWRDVSDEHKINHLKALRRDARAAGIDVPIFTCWTKQCRSSSDPELKDVFDGGNMYPRWNITPVVQRLRQIRDSQPNAPVMIPECQGGWFSQVGGQLSEDQEGLSAAQINHLTLLALACDTTILNYYMLSGGTNFGDWAARSITTTYDYNSPIREPGGVGDRFLVVKSIGQMLREHGTELARAKAVKCDVSDGEGGVEFRVRRSKDGAIFVFCRNSSIDPKRPSSTVKLEDGAELSVACQLPPRGFKVLYFPAGQTDSSQGQWLPKELSSLDRPAAPQGVRIRNALRRADGASDSPGDWSKTGGGESLISRGIYDSRFALFRANVTLDAAQAKNLDTLWLDLLRQDGAVLKVNGRIVHPRGTHHGQPMFPLKGNLQPGENQIVALYENKGYNNGGRGMESLPGVRSAMLTSADQMGAPIVDWRVKLVPQNGEGDDLVVKDLEDADWSDFKLDDAMTERLAQTIQQSAQTKQDEAARVLFNLRRKAVFRASVNVSDADIKAGRTRLTFDKIDDSGRIFVNGEEIGQSKSYEKSATFDVAKSLRAGRNSIAVLVDNSGGGIGGLLAPVYLETEKLAGLPVSWEFAPNAPGFAQEWWRAQLDTSGWTQIQLDTQKPIERKGGTSTTPSERPDALLTWYRMEFELPDPAKDVWVPWRAILDASGNGFVYFNGHALGRYWEIGPQREFYLPECWLKFGAGEKNLLTVCLRSTDRGSTLRAAEVQPYADQVERRPTSNSN